MQIYHFPVWGALTEYNWAFQIYPWTNLSKNLNEPKFMELANLFKLEKLNN